MRVSILVPKAAMIGAVGIVAVHQKPSLTPSAMKPPLRGATRLIFVEIDLLHPLGEWGAEMGPWLIFSPASKLPHVTLAAIGAFKE